MSPHNHAYRITPRSSVYTLRDAGTVGIAKNFRALRRDQLQEVVDGLLSWPAPRPPVVHVPLVLALAELRRRQVDGRWSA